MTEQRVAALEAQIVELRDANLQLKGALDEQRAQAAVRQPAQQQVVHARLMGKPKNFNGNEDEVGYALAAFTGWDVLESRHGFWSGASGIVVT